MTPIEKKAIERVHYLLVCAQVEKRKLESSGALPEESELHKVLFEARDWIESFTLDNNTKTQP